MDRLLFALALVLTARSISLLTGRNRRQLQKVPEGMSILCQPPGKRYILYALGVVVMAQSFCSLGAYTSWTVPLNPHGQCGACASQWQY